MITKVFTKKQTQQVLKDLRSAGYDVQKIKTGYIVELDGTLLLKAMIGHMGYLVRYDEQLLT